MANHHFGNIGDVFKHLLLAEAVAAQRPLRYWESHAGAASHELDDAPERRAGVRFFVDHQAANPALAASRFAGLLRELMGAAGDARRPAVYPGSALIAMRLLGAGDRPATFLFCDRDTHSLESIAHHARELGLPPAQVYTTDSDGPTRVSRAARELAPDQYRDTFVLIDPPDPFEGEPGATPIDLFRDLLTIGVPAMLWWGAADAASRDRTFAALREAVAGAAAGDVWSSELEITPQRLAAPAGLFAAGVVCAHFTAEVVRQCSTLGRELSTLYNGGVG